MIDSLRSGLGPLVTAPAAQDSVILPPSPLPGGAAAIVRFFFQSVPQWIQIGGFFAAALGAVAALFWLWQRRVTLVSWLTTRSRGLKIGLGTSAAALALVVAGAGKISWDYMQHDNGFCTGCHVMEGAFARFTESKHDSLSCHDCHQQSIFASTRQLYLWVVERPEGIGEHAPVPNTICETCHVTGEPEVWQRVASTAGHRTHLESDSSALSQVMCVTCHGQEVHRFVPVDQTCAQSDCHVDQEIALGAMQDQTSLHCITCHEFTAEVPLLATTDSAMGTLTPKLAQCNSCHEMQDVLADFDPAFDPHAGSCGTCHDPHTQSDAAEAAQSCATAGCHEDWRTEPFHVGTEHMEVGSQCLVCHAPHRAKVDASDCVGCHASVVERDEVPGAVRNRLRRSLPFDTARVLSPRPDTSVTAAAALGGWLFQRHAVLGAGVILAGRYPPWLRAEVLTVPPDTFSHNQHSDLSCLTCHTTSTGHGALTFEAPRGCQICHHQAPATSDCATCHGDDDLDARVPVTIAVTVGDSTRREREVDLIHTVHTTPSCVDCHTQMVTLAASPSATDCTDCHADHHAPNRQCGVCHAGDHAEEAHAPPVEAHIRCDACHARSTVATLLPDRAFCLTCHDLSGIDRVTAHLDEGKECTTCHFLASPDEFRHRLLVRRDGL